MVLLNRKVIVMYVRVGLVVAAVAAAFASVSSVALAVTPGWECVPTTAGRAITSGGTGSAPVCPSGRTPVLAPTFVSSGVGGKATVQLSGVNLQVVNGSGSETTLNGEGNLVIGYDPKPQAQTGSHNLVMGTVGQSYTSYGGVLAGFSNQISGPEASITGGFNSTATGVTADITGGEANTASGQDSWIGGGLGNRATGADSAVSGGALNLASGSSGSILGGVNNVASGNDSAVGGGDGNTASGGNSVASSVSGGTGNVASGQDSWVGGGSFNAASGDGSSAGGSLVSLISLDPNWQTQTCCGNRAPAWYTDGSGVVHLQGAVGQLSPTNTSLNLIGTLPPDASPDHTVYTIAHTLSGTYADLAITPQGQIFAIASRSPAVTDWGFVSLEGITYEPVTRPNGQSARRPARSAANRR
jgi:hypothetical protein